MALKTGGSEGVNLAYGIGGRVIGGALGYLVGGFGGMQAGWGAGGSLGDSLGSPMTYETTKRTTDILNPNLQYEGKRLKNRESNFQTVDEERPGRVPVYLKTLDTAMNLTSAGLGLYGQKNPDSKIGQFTNSGSPLFGNGKPSNKKLMSTLTAEGGHMLSQGSQSTNPFAKSSIIPTIDLDPSKVMFDMTKQINSSFLKNNNKNSFKTNQWGGTMPNKIDLGTESSLFNIQTPAPFLNQNFQFNPYT